MVCECVRARADAHTQCHVLCGVCVHVGFVYVCVRARAHNAICCAVCVRVCVCARAHAHNAMRVKAVSTVDWTVSPTVNRTVSLKDKAGGPH